MTDANLPAGNSKEGKTNVSFTEASISEEPSAVVPHAGICAGGSRVTGCPTVTTYGFFSSASDIRKTAALAT